MSKIKVVQLVIDGDQNPCLVDDKGRVWISKDFQPFQPIELPEEPEQASVDYSKEYEPQYPPEEPTL